jgi:hypothetical protein
MMSRRRQHINDAIDAFRLLLRDWLNPYDTERNRAIMRSLVVSSSRAALESDPPVTGLMDC